MRLYLIGLFVLLGIIIAQAQIISTEAPNVSASSGKAYKDELGLIGDYFYITANLGAGLPIGKYSSVDIRSNDSRFASPGFDARLNLGIIFKRFVGLTASFGVLSHNINIDQYSNRLNLINPGLLITDIEYKGFKHFYGTSGLLLSFPISPVVSFDARIQAGFVYGIEARKLLIVTDGMGFARVEVEKALDGSFIFDPGISLKILPVKRLLLMVSIDYMLASYHFRSVRQTINGVNPIDLDYKTRLNNISLCFGIGILLK